MNLGLNANDNLTQRNPTYLVAPNYTTRPFPDGPFELGTLVEDIKDFYPINQGADNRVQIPAGERYSDIKENVVTHVKTSRSGEARLFAHILDRSIGGDVSLKGQKGDEDTYVINKLETVYFYPRSSYVRGCLRLPDIREFLEACRYKEPMYLITGLKLAWGATVATEKGHRYEGAAGQSMTVPGGLVDVSINSNAGLSSDAQLRATYEKPADFVLGIQVQKIYHKRGLFSGEPVLRTERVSKKAALLDDEGMNREQDSDFGFIAESLNKAEVDDLVPWDVQVSGQKPLSEHWLIPSKAH